MKKIIWSTCFFKLRSRCNIPNQWQPKPQLKYLKQTKMTHRPNECPLPSPTPNFQRSWVYHMGIASLLTVSFPFVLILVWVLVQAAVKKLLTGGLNHRNYISQFYKLELRSGCQHRQIPMRTPLQVADCPLLVACSHMKEERELYGVLFIRAPVPSMGTSPSWPNHLPKALHPNTITLELRFQHMIFEGQKHPVHCSQLAFCEFYKVREHFLFTFLSPEETDWHSTFLLRDHE